MSDLMPNVSYHSKSTVVSMTNKGEHLLQAAISDVSTVSDTGVFVSGSADSKCPGCPRWDTRITKRYAYTTTSGTRYPPMGGINMDVGDDHMKLYTFAFAGSTATSNSPETTHIFLAFDKGHAVNNGFITSQAVLMSPTQAEMGITRYESTKVSILADKVEIGHKTDSKEIVYITGVTMSIRVDDDFAYRGGIIVARSIPMVGSGFAESTSNGSILFTHDGIIRSTIQGDNASSVSSATISQAIPEEAIVSNDSILAVSCMAEAEGQAHWLGYKNGIYKLYQGTKPLNGLPGERVVVKGHDFVCPAYGPYYARMS